MTGKPCIANFCPVKRPALSITIPEEPRRELEFIARVFEDSDFQCWLVGGAVRDALLGRSTEDFDLATDARPKAVQRLFRRTVPTGIKHGTVSILRGRCRFETTTFRSDGTYADGRHPDSVAYSSDIREDLSRRDFTVNAIAWNLIKGEFLDPHDGRGDLERKIIRAIGSAQKRFAEDALRPVRACRFASQLNFTIQADTLAAIEGTLKGVRGLSRERIWDELRKILRSPKPSRAFRLFRDTGLLKVILPELAARVDADPRGRPVRDAFERCLELCDRINAAHTSVRTAALFSGAALPAPAAPPKITKTTQPAHPKATAPQGNTAPQATTAQGNTAPSGTTQTVGTTAGTADGTGSVCAAPDEASALIAENALQRLKTSRALRDRVVRLVRRRPAHCSSQCSDADVRRFIRHIGPDLVDDLLMLCIADAENRSSETPAPAAADLEELRRLRRRVSGVLQRKEPLSIDQLAVNGRVLMDKLALKSGRPIGRLLEALLEHVLDNPEMNRPGSLLELSKRLLESGESD